MEETTEKVVAETTDTGKTPESPTGRGEKSDSPSEEKLPFDQHPKWKEARTSAKKLNDLLKANDLDDADDLVELIEKGKAVKGKISDLNQIDSIIEKANKLDKYEAYWKDQEERKRRETEDPDQTIIRLERELKHKNANERMREEQRQQADNAKMAIQSYEREVSNLIKEMEIPKEQQGFTLEFFGVGNPANDIDITDRKAIKRLIADGLKKKESYDQAVIKTYLGKKDEMPKLGSSAGAATTETKPKIMLKDARRIFLETMQKSAGG